MNGGARENVPGGADRAKQAESMGLARLWRLVFGASFRLPNERPDRYANTSLSSTQTISVKTIGR